MIIITPVILVNQVILPENGNFRFSELPNRQLPYQAEKLRLDAELLLSKIRAIEDQNRNRKIDIPFSELTFTKSDLQKNGSVSVESGIFTGLRLSTSKQVSGMRVSCDRFGFLRALSRHLTDEEKWSIERLYKTNVKLPAGETKKVATEMLKVSYPPLFERFETKEGRSGYSSDELIKLDPYLTLEMYAENYGIPWGPGRTAQVTIDRFTGRFIHLIRSRAFSSVEKPVDLISQERAEQAAVSAALRLGEVNQTNIVKFNGKFITGNGFLGSYFKDTPRLAHIAKNNLGVAAYSFQLGNGQFDSQGRPGIAYEALIDAKTGEPISVNGFALFGGPNMMKNFPLKVKSRYKSIWIQKGTDKKRFSNIRLIETGSSQEMAKELVYADGIYTLGKLIGKERLLLAGKVYAIRR